MQKRKNNHSLMTNPEIATLIILAGPSGAGKTTISMEILAGRDPDGVSLDRSLGVQRIDMKLLHRTEPPTGNIILEYAINAFDPKQDDISDLMNLIEHATDVYVTTIHVPKREIASRYIAQMYAATGRRTPKWARTFQLRKWYRYARYRFSKDVDTYYANWKCFLRNKVTPLNHVKVIDQEGFFG